MRIDPPGIEAFLGIIDWGSFRRAALLAQLVAERLERPTAQLGKPGSTTIERAL